MHETTRLQLDLDKEARARSQALEAAGKLPAGFTAAHHPLSQLEQRELRRLQACGELAQDADTYVALARGRSVPRSWLRSRLTDFIQRR